MPSKAGTGCHAHAGAGGWRGAALTWQPRAYGWPEPVWAAALMTYEGLFPAPLLQSGPMAAAMQRPLKSDCTTKTARIVDDRPTIVASLPGGWRVPPAGRGGGRGRREVGRWAAQSVNSRFF